MKTNALIKVKGMILAAAALACALTLAPGVALAEGDPVDAQLQPTPNGVITAELQMPQGVEAKDVTFTYSFRGVSVDGATAVAPPQIKNVEVTVGKAYDGTPVSAPGSTTYAKSSPIVLPEAKEFNHAGDFAYDVFEVQGALSVSKVSHSQATFQVHVFVVNDNSATDQNNLAIKGITVWKTADDAGKPIASPAKVNPEVTAGTNGSGFVFAHAYKPEGTSFQVSKVVEGDYADRTKKFDFEITVTKPAYVANTSVLARVYNADGSQDSGNSFYLANGEVKGFTLADGQYLKFVNNDLPVGTTYTVTEKGVEGYTPSAVAHTSAAAASGGPIADTTFGPDADGSGNLTAEYTEGSALILGVDNAAHNANTIVFTNTYKSVSPTGIFVDNLPYVLMVGIPLGCAVLYLVAKRRKVARISQ